MVAQSGSREVARGAWVLCPTRPGWKFYQRPLVAVLIYATLKYGPKTVNGYKRVFREPGQLPVRRTIGPPVHMFMRRIMSLSAVIK